MLRVCFSVFFSCLALLEGCAICHAEFIINVNYSGNQIYQPFFVDAANRWQALISGYQNGFVVGRSAGSTATIGTQLTTLNINASVEAIDGVGQVLGAAGPTAIVTDQLNFKLASDGLMRFDIADISSLIAGNVFDDVILHEMGHVMGFGTLWTDNGVYETGNGEFTGITATSFWQSEFSQTGPPKVELGGGSGTRDGHWDEVDGGSGFTAIRDSLGRDMRYELMTGWLNNDAQGTPFISNMTLGSFVDIGYQANFQAVPEPGALLCIAMAGGLLIGPSRLRRRFAKKD